MRLKLLRVIVIVQGLFSIQQIAFADLLGAVSLVQSVGNRLAGYRAHRVKINGDCSINVVRHVHPKTRRFTLVLHGISDSRFGADLIRKSGAVAGAEPTQFIYVETPRHGDSNCEIVQSLKEAVGRINQALDIEFTSERAKTGDEIKSIVAVSLGAAMAPAIDGSFLPKNKSDLNFTLIVPPFVDTDHLDPLLAKLKQLSTQQDMQQFLNQILTEPRPFPAWVLAGLTRRFVRAQPLLQNIDSEFFRARVMSLSAAQVRIVVGQKDKLLPEAEYDPDFVKKFKTSFRYVPCGHDATFTCVKEIGQILVERGH